MYHSMHGQISLFFFFFQSILRLGEQWKFFYLSFSKAFDTCLIGYNIPLTKRWIENWKKCQAQKAVTRVTKSSWKLITNCVPHRSTLGPILHNICFNGLDEGTEHTLSKFADNIKLKAVAGTPDACAAIRRTLRSSRMGQNRTIWILTKRL